MHLIGLVNLFLQKGIEFSSLIDTIDTRTLAGKLILTIFCSLGFADTQNLTMILKKMPDHMAWRFFCIPGNE
ncbi:hypothetical protein HMF3257_04250 [Spirosoma telluris]|uniref:Uncharacterized protein n=1 Tax=Spirosoma telluris TaxID=2183553 RepID=A0A327NEU7_9BACT|nr:hypothetical protein HMF3257_04250 [Spirosoma telluris]